MKEILEKKLESNEHYSTEQINWLLDHIGDPDPIIRDQLVYASFCHLFLDEIISKDQAQQLFEQSQQRQLLSQDSLTRSFASLLYDLIIAIDEDRPHYQNFLTNSQLQILFEQALNIFTFENDWRGYDENLGWIHAGAHGADFLLAATCHQSFPADKFEQAWQALIDCCLKQNSTFSAGEETRLAQIPVYLILNQKVSASTLATWMEQLDVPNQEPVEYFRWLNIQRFLSSIYFQLKSHQALAPEVEQAIEKQIRLY
ncbi:DUF2785 domain-containing protein [Streptococcus suis]